jgi:hypothetical protein
MDTMSEIYTLIETAENAVHEQRFELARALAAIAQARALADIARALRDDEGNNIAHMLATIAAALADSDARDELAQTVAIYGS